MSPIQSPSDSDSQRRRKIEQSEGANNPDQPSFLQRVMRLKKPIITQILQALVNLSQSGVRHIELAGGTPHPPLSRDALASLPGMPNIREEGETISGEELRSAIAAARDLLVGKDLQMQPAPRLELTSKGIISDDHEEEPYNPREAMHTCLALLLDEMLINEHFSSESYLIQTTPVGLLIVNGGPPRLLRDVFVDSIHPSSDMVSELRVAREQGGFSLTQVPDDALADQPHLIPLVREIFDSLYRAADKALQPLDELRARLPRFMDLDEVPDLSNPRVIDQEFEGTPAAAPSESQPVKRSDINHGDQTLFALLRELRGQFVRHNHDLIADLMDRPSQKDPNFSDESPSLLLQQLPPAQNLRQQLINASLESLAPRSATDALNPTSQALGSMLAHLDRAPYNDHHAHLKDPIHRALARFGVAGLKKSLLQHLDEDGDEGKTKPTVEPPILTGPAKNLLEELVIFGSLPRRYEHAGAAHAILFQDIRFPEEPEDFSIADIIAADYREVDRLPTASEHLARIYIAIRRLVKGKQGLKSSVTALFMSLTGYLASSKIFIRQGADAATDQDIPLMTQRIEDLIELIEKHANPLSAEAVLLQNFWTYVVDYTIDEWRQQDILGQLRRNWEKAVGVDEVAEDEFIEWYDRRLQPAHKESIGEFAVANNIHAKAVQLGEGLEAFSSEMAAITLPIERGLLENEERLIGQLGDTILIDPANLAEDLEALQQLGVAYPIYRHNRLQIALLLEPNSAA